MSLDHPAIGRWTGHRAGTCGHCLFGLAAVWIMKLQTDLVLGIGLEIEQAAGVTVLPKERPLGPMAGVLSAGSGNTGSGRLSGRSDAPVWSPLSFDVSDLESDASSIPSRLPVHPNNPATANSGKRLWCIGRAVNEIFMEWSPCCSKSHALGGC